MEAKECKKILKAIGPSEGGSTDPAVSLVEQSREAVRYHKEMAASVGKMQAALQQAYDSMECGTMTAEEQRAALVDTALSSLKHLGGHLANTMVGMKDGGPTFAVTSLSRTQSLPQINTPSPNSTGKLSQPRRHWASSASSISSVGSPSPSKASPSFQRNRIDPATLLEESQDEAHAALEGATQEVMRRVKSQLQPLDHEQREAQVEGGAGGGGGGMFAARMRQQKETTRVARRLLEKQSSKRGTDTLPEVHHGVEGNPLVGDHRVKRATPKAARSRWIEARTSDMYLFAEDGIAEL